MYIVVFVYCIWCSDSKPTYFGAANWAKSKFWNGYNSVICKAIIMKNSESIDKCHRILNMQKNENIIYHFSWKTFENRRFFKIGKLYFWFFTFLNCHWNSQCLLILFINLDFKNDWVIAIWKFQLCTSLQQSMQKTGTTAITQSFLK